MLSTAKHLLFLAENKQKEIASLRSAQALPSTPFDFAQGRRAESRRQYEIGSLFNTLLRKAWLVFAPLLLASCSRAPSFDILGSFFPAWLVCLAVAILLTALARWLLLRLHIAVVVPVLVYPSLTFLFAFALWLVFFR
jgi:hypothetical protein